MFAAFAVARQLHELLWHLAEAETRTFDSEVADRAAQLRNTIERALGGDLALLLSTDVQQLHAEVRALLMEVSAHVRAGYGAAGDDGRPAGLRPGADLMGRDLRGLLLSGADLRGAYLIGADLRGTDLSGSDLLGADLRDARLEGADLSRALFLTQAQLNAARGSDATRVPVDLELPGHWLNG